MMFSNEFLQIVKYVQVPNTRRVSHVYASVTWSWLSCVAIIAVLESPAISTAQQHLDNLNSIGRANRTVSSVTSIDAKKTIDSLASKNAAPRLVGFKDERRPLFDNNFDWAEQDRIDKAIKVLSAHAEEAWPELVSHLDDKRYAITYRVLDSAWNFTIGEVCESIISDAISQAYYIHLPAGAVRSHQAQMLMDFPPPTGERILKLWCEKWRNKRLYELQIEMCNWAIEKIPSLTDASKSEQEDSIVAIKAQIDYARTTQKAVDYCGFYRSVPLHLYRQTSDIDQSRATK